MNNKKFIIIVGKKVGKTSKYNLKNRYKNKVEIWDISGVGSDVSYESIDKVKRIKEEVEIEKKIEKNTKHSTYFSFDCMQGKKGLHKLCYRWIKKHNLKIVKKINSSTPTYKYGEGIIGEYTAYLGYLKRALNRVGKISPDYILVPTKRSLREVNCTDISTKVFKLHTVDYDRYLKVRSRSAKNKYGVFVDQNIPFYKEVSNVYGGKSITPKNYYYEVNMMIEKCVNSDDINIEDFKIALHPSSSIAKAKRFLGKWEIHQGKTAEMISKSRLVVGHYSTSLLYAVMFGVPVCIFATEEMKNCAMIDVVKKVAKSFNKEIKDPRDIESINLNYSSKAYKKLKKSFVKEPGTPDMNSYSFMYERIAGI